MKKFNYHFIFIFFELPTNNKNNNKKKMSNQLFSKEFIYYSQQQQKMSLNCVFPFHQIHLEAKKVSIWQTTKIIPKPFFWNIHVCIFIQKSEPKKYNKILHRMFIYKVRVRKIIWFISKAFKIIKGKNNIKNAFCLRCFITFVTFIYYTDTYALTCMYIENVLFFCDIVHIYKK